MKVPYFRSPGSNAIQMAAAYAEQSGWYRAAQRLANANHALSRYMLDERTADWRFLLPDARRMNALCIGGGLSVVPFVLAKHYRAVTVVCGASECAFLRIRAQQEGVTNITPLVQQGGVMRSRIPGAERGFSLVACLRGTPDKKASLWRSYSVRSAATRVARGGVLYLEADLPSIVLPPRLLAWKMGQAGISQVKCYWPKPDFNSCELILPLGDVRLQRYYLSRLFFAMSPARRVLRRVLGLAARFGAFELALPGYMAIGKREVTE